MPRNQAEQEAWERQAYGCLAADFWRSVEDSPGVAACRAVAPGTDRTRGYGMVAMSLLSDAQEMLAHGDAEGSRQAINRAKLVIADKWMEARR